MFTLRYLRRLLKCFAPQTNSNRIEALGEEDADNDKIDMPGESQTVTQSEPLSSPLSAPLTDDAEEQRVETSAEGKKLKFVRFANGKGKAKSGRRGSISDVGKAAKVDVHLTRRSLKTKYKHNRGNEEDTSLFHECGACFDQFKEAYAENEESAFDTASEAVHEEESDKDLDDQPGEGSRGISDEAGLGVVFACQNRLCYSCLSSYILGRMKDAGNGVSLRPLSCHECRKLDDKPGCITNDHVKSVLTTAEWDQFEQALILEDLGRKMYCPNSACGAVFDADDILREQAEIVGVDSKVVCPACKKVACIRCNIEWHNGFTCEEYKSRPQFLQQEDNDREATLAMARKSGWRSCPRPTCGHMIELTLGCNHITCVCGEEFCFLCLAPWHFERDAAGLILSQRCSRGSLGGRPACPLYSERPTRRVQQVQELRFRRHSMQWIQEDRTDMPYQKSNTFTRHMLASRQCGYCQYKGKNWPRLIEHLETVSHDVFDCCAKFYETRKDFDSHVRNAHPTRVWVPAAAVLRRE